MFYTGKNKEIDFAKIPDAIKEYYSRNIGFTSDISILIGTDSQNFDITKCVSVICVVAKGRGGIFFYEISKIPIIHDIRRKLQVETNDSLNLATQLVDLLDSDKKYEDVFLNCPISIHVDAGNSEKGKTKAPARSSAGAFRCQKREAFSIRRRPRRVGSRRSGVSGRSNS